MINECSMAASPGKALGRGGGAISLFFFTAFVGRGLGEGGGVNQVLPVLLTTLLLVKLS